MVFLRCATGNAFSAGLARNSARFWSKPTQGGRTRNLGRSLGFESMAISPAGTRLYPLLEGTVEGDIAIDGSNGQNLHISEFKIKTRSYPQNQRLHKLEAAGANIGGMIAINDRQFLVIERNGATATGGGIPFTKLFIADIEGVATGGFDKKDRTRLPDEHQRSP